MIHWKDWCWSSNTLATWCEEPTRWKRPWCWERLKAGGEGDDRGQDGWMASPTQWTRESSGRWWRTGKTVVLQSKGLQRDGHDWAVERQQHSIPVLYTSFRTLLLKWMCELCCCSKLYPNKPRWGLQVAFSILIFYNCFLFCPSLISYQTELQLTLEQHGLEQFGSTCMWIFFTSEQWLVKYVDSDLQYVGTMYREDLL